MGAFCQNFHAAGRDDLAGGGRQDRDAVPAGNYVSNILAKLGLRSRTEAAIYAVLHLGQESGDK
jgi:hypothetical protein